jgi:hypothetical protein
MKGRRLFFSALLVVGCTNTTPRPTTSTAPSSTGAKPHVEDDGRCLASTARRRPAGWAETGTLVITLDDGRPIQLEARDAAGKTVESRPAPTNAREAREAVAALTCRVGGLIAALDGPEPPRTGTSTSTLIILGPTTADEKTDLAILCTEPEELPAEADTSTKLRLSIDRFEEHLTTRRWRAWLRDLVEEDSRREGAERIMLWSSRADDLHAAAANVGIAGSCWLEAGLRRAAR